MAETIINTSLVQEVILPFLLVFVVIFAILQKTKILGDGKKQIDALVALAVGLIVISFGYATGIIITLVPFLAVSAIVILVFMILYGMTFHGDKKFEVHKYVMAVIGGLVALGVIVVLLSATGGWIYLRDNFFYDADGTSSILVNAIFIVVIAVAVGMAVWGGKDEKK